MFALPVAPPGPTVDLCVMRAHGLHCCNCSVGGIATEHCGASEWRRPAHTSPLAQIALRVVTGAPDEAGGNRLTDVMVVTSNTAGRSVAYIGFGGGYPAEGPYSCGYFAGD